MKHPIYNLYLTNQVIHLKNRIQDDTLQEGYANLFDMTHRILKLFNCPKRGDVTYPVVVSLWILLWNYLVTRESQDPPHGSVLDSCLEPAIWFIDLSLYQSRLQYFTWCQRWIDSNSQRVYLYTATLPTTGANGSNVLTLHDRIWQKQKSDEVKTATLLHLAGPDALEVFNTFTFATPGDDKKLNKVLEQFEAHCIPRTNVTCERHIFKTRKQQSDETIDKYVTNVRNKAKTCEFGVLTESLIRDRKVCGISSDKTRTRLLKQANLTLATALDICRADEVTATQ